MKARCSQDSKGNATRPGSARVSSIDVILSTHPVYPKSVSVSVRTAVLPTELTLSVRVEVTGLEPLTFPKAFGTLSQASKIGGG